MNNLAQNAIINFRERITQSAKTITTDHTYIHQGYMYWAYVKPTIDPAGTYKLTFTTPSVASGKEVHWRPSTVNPDADKVFLTMTEEPTAVTPGTAVQVRNRNRKLVATGHRTDAGLSVVTGGATLTESAVVVEAAYMGGGTGTGQARSSTDTGEENEVFLNPATTYSITITNGSSNTQDVFLKMLWYEEDKV